MAFLLTRPEHEDTVFYLSVWSKELIEKAQEKGLKTLDCHREKANRNTFEKMISQHHPKLVMINGHGNESTITGHRNEPLVIVGENEVILSGAIVYARSCSTGAELGERSVAAGAVSYIGYRQVFMLWLDPRKISRPLQDEFAQPFLESSNHIVSTLLNGGTAKEAYERSQACFEREIERLSRSDAPPEAQYILPLLYWDKENQVLLGLKDSRI